MATTAKTIRKTTWNTYGVSGYIYDCANDQRSAGGVHIHQVRLGRHGWQHRICQSNGGRKAYSPVTPIDDATGEARFEQAKQY
jgi:hypothetical protein